MQFLIPDEDVRFEAINLNWESIVTPVQPKVLERLLTTANYDPTMIKQLVKGFTDGFDLGYRGPTNRRNTARNLPFRIGNPKDLWDKIMSEVKANRYAGPFTEENFPFSEFIQSPLGLVPKSGGKQRLIFHLSFDFGEDEAEKSVNHHTPSELCMVKYQDLDCAVRQCIELLRMTGVRVPIYFSKSDFSNAFRVLPILVHQRRWLIMQANHPVTRVIYWFIDLCLPFGSSRSCALFQAFSNALKFIVQHRLSATIEIPFGITNYLDDFLFLTLSIKICDGMIQEFMVVCQLVGCPVSVEKTEYATTRIVFPGILLDGNKHVLVVPAEKRVKALNLINWAISKKKVTIKFIQQLTGTLNFLNRAIVPGRAFTRGMYAKLKLTDKDGKNLKQHHHVWLNQQFLEDCKMWKTFLVSGWLQLCRPFIDLDAGSRNSRILEFYSDSSKNAKLGMGAIFIEQGTWLVKRWNEDFINQENPSIEFLELYALVAAVCTWNGSDLLCNSRVTIHCDNQAVVYMVNNLASSCMQCMKLIRILVLDSIRCNRRLFARYVSTTDNFLADAISRFKFGKFWRLAPSNTKPEPDVVRLIEPEKLWNSLTDYLY